MAKFSERYGYTTPSSVLIREKLTDEIINAVCTEYDLLRDWIEGPEILYNPLPYDNQYVKLEKHLWTDSLCRRLNYYSLKKQNITNYIQDKNNPWYKTLDLIEESISYLVTTRQYTKSFMEGLNRRFQNINFAYRIVDNQVVEITSEEEIAEIEKSLQNPSNGVKEHLHTALELLSKRPEGDYRNSIKESISAVECIVREITGGSDFDIDKLEKKTGTINSQLRQAFKNLYSYTNDKTTGIRHAQMEDTHAPGADEAIFMLASCSAFINYLTKKRTQ
jgi:hypothetical protein